VTDEPKFSVVAATADLGPGDQIHVEVDGEDILLCNYQGEYYAVGYYCTHAWMPLEGGFLEDGCVGCPYHGAMFSLTDGSIVMPPANGGIATYPVRIEGDAIAISATPTNTP